MLKKMKEESGNFMCPKCGYEFSGKGTLYAVSLIKWISREKKGVKKWIFYGKNNNETPSNNHWYGKVRENHYDSDTDSEDSCGIKRHIHIPSRTYYIWINYESPEECWEETGGCTEKEWNKYIDLECWKCSYKSQFVDFIIKN